LAIQGHVINSGDLYISRPITGSTYPIWNHGHFRVKSFAQIN